MKIALSFKDSIFRHANERDVETEIGRQIKKCCI